jgi:predicted metalloprotease with PDZ domain
MRYQTVILTGFLIAGPAQAAPDPTVHYSLKPILTDGQATAVEFEMRFHATQARTEVDLPDFGAGHYGQYKNFKAIEVTGATAMLIPPDHPSQRLITAVPGAEITVRYHIDANLKAGDEAPINTDMTYPVIGPTRFTIMGETVWPTVNSGGDLPATFAADMPAGWAFASNLENLPAMGGTDAEVIKTILMGGNDVHIETIQTPHTRLRIATAGRFDFTMADFNDRATRVIETEQAFWNDGQPDFLVTLAPTTPQPGRLSIHGEAMNGAFATMAVPYAPLQDISFNLAHEYFHSWNMRKLGQWASGHEALSYWFSEGFTDYYGRKLALKSGVVSLGQFVTDWNAALSRYAGSPHKLAPNSDLDTHYGADQAWTKAIYDRGAILAVYLNAKWRAKGVTLDRFMHSLRDRVATDPALAAMPTRQRVATVAAGLGMSANDDLTRFIDKGEAITLPEDAFGGCIRVVTDPADDKIAYVRQQLVLPTAMTADEVKACTAAITG